MRHAAHGTHKTSGASSLTKSLFQNTSRGAHAIHASARHGAHVAAAVAAPVNGIAALDADVLARMNEIVPRTRRSIREAARAAQRRNTILTSTSLAALVGTAATGIAFANTQDMGAMALSEGETTTTTQITRVNTVAASRSEARQELTTDNVQATSNEGDWNLGSSNVVSDTEAVNKSIANNPQIAQLMSKHAADLPTGFNPNHGTGDTGNAYPYGQCTWWAYTRRAQLGLPTGSYFGNAQSWGASASALGYWVDNTARETGDAVVFGPGQEGASSVYGHVAVVEKVNPDGSIEISESNAKGLGVISNRTFTAEQAAQLTYIHF